MTFVVKSKIVRRKNSSVGTLKKTEILFLLSPD
jgi:hypothetical protein